MGCARRLMVRELKWWARCESIDGWIPQPANDDLEFRRFKRMTFVALILLAWTIEATFGWPSWLYRWIGHSVFKRERQACHNKLNTVADFGQRLIQPSLLIPKCTTKRRFGHEAQADFVRDQNN